MSGHNNSHGHLGQPNASWNPLQVPFVSRQPQLAHLSSERPISHSPLTWHTPTPQEALFSYLSTNHKSTTDINPLLPAFSRPQNTSPFGTVDLSLTNTSKVASPKSFSASPSCMGDAPPPPPPLPQINQGLLPMSPQQSVIQSTASIAKERTNNCNNSPSTTQGIFVKDARQINNDIMKFSREMQPTQNTDPAADTIKSGVLYSSIKSLPATSPKRNSPLRPSFLPNQSPTPSHTPPTTNNSSPAGTPTTSNLQNQPVQPDLPQPEYHDIATTNNLSLPQNTSNTDLLELSAVNNRSGSNAAAAKKRNRRKPNKTTKVFNDDEAHLGLRDDDDIYDGKFNGIDVNGAVQPAVEQPMDTQASVPIETPTNGSKASTEPAATEIPIMSLVNEPAQIGGSDAQLNVENSLGNNVSVCDSKDDDKPTTNEASIVNTDVNELEQMDEISKTSAVPLTTKGKGKPTMTTSTPTAKTKKRGRRKTITAVEDNNSDDSEVETIDKIAEMISSTSKEFECSESLSMGGEKSSDTVKTTTAVESMEISAGSTTTAGTATTSKQQPVVKELQKNDANYEDVENKLEEMFAGIEEDLSSRNASGSEKPTETLPTNELSIFENPSSAAATQGTTSGTIISKKKGAKRTNSTTTNNNKASDKLEDLSDFEAPPPAKKKRPPQKKNNKNLKSNKNNNNSNNNSSKKNGKNNKSVASTSSSSKSKVKDEPTSELKYKGPFLQVKKCGSMSVINTPIADDDVEKSINKSKKIIYRETMNDRNKIRGLHVSTLSMKYDADTTDHTWMCVFCKLGPHKSGLGDLFGPYIVTTNSEEYQYSQVDPSEDVFSEKRSRLDLASKRAGCSSSQISSPQAKKKKKNIDIQPSTSKPSTPAQKEIDIHAGMVKANDNTYEIWVHEECAVWAPGVHMIGARIVGLEAAIWTSCRHKCTICNGYGAMLCCLKYNCPEKAHINCAYSSNWKLGTDFKSYCEVHNV